jgi:hypothetical protein
MTAQGSLCDIHRCPLYGELSARPPPLAIGLPVALLGGFEFFALALLGLGNHHGLGRYEPTPGAAMAAFAESARASAMRQLASRER